MTTTTSQVRTLAMDDFRRGIVDLVIDWQSPLTTFSRWFLFFWIPFFALSRAQVWCATTRLQSFDVGTLVVYSLGIAALAMHFVTVLFPDLWPSELFTGSNRALMFLAVSSLMLHLAFATTQGSTFNPVVSGCNGNATNVAHVVTYATVFNAYYNANNTSPCVSGITSSISCDEYNVTMGSIAMFVAAGLLWVCFAVTYWFNFDLSFRCFWTMGEKPRFLPEMFLFLNVVFFGIATSLGTASIINAFPNYSVLVGTDILRGDISMFMLMWIFPALLVVGYFLASE